MASFKSFYRPQRSWGKVIFSEECVKNSVHRGGMHGGGMCVAGEACVVGGMHGRGGHVWQGACVAEGGMHGRGGVHGGGVHGRGAYVADTTRYGQ